MSDQEAQATAESTERGGEAGDAGETAAGPAPPGRAGLRPGLALAAWVVGLAALVAGDLVLASRGRPGISVAILLFVLAGASLGVAIGGARDGAGPEGRLDLGTRIGLGLLGGWLGGLVSAAFAWWLSAVGITGGLGVGLEAGFGSGWGARVWQAGLWGVAFGVAYRLVPGDGAVRRGLVFSLLPCLYLWLLVFPFQRGVGYFGLQLGALTPLFVLFFQAIWGVVTAVVVRWGERTELAPLSRPLVE